MNCKVYSTKNCSKCAQLERALISKGVEFDSIDMATPEALTELRVNGIFVLSAPVLQVEDNFYTMDELFDGEQLRDLSAFGIPG